jgi:ligand-binding sensor domain-containing protein
MATRRWLAGGALLALLATLFTGRRLEPCVRGLPLDLSGLLLERGAELTLPRPVLHQELELRPGPGRLAVVHHGSELPARAAVTVGQQTWIATPAGVLRHGPELWRDPPHARALGRIGAEVLGAPEVNALFVLGPDQVLVGTDDGLHEVDRRGRARGAPRLRGQRVTALTRSWIGTWDGVHRLRDLAPLPGSEGLRVTDLLECGDRLFVATHDRGLLQLSRDPPRILPVPGVPPGTRVASLAGCRRGCGPVLAATLDGVYTIDPHGLRAERLHDDPLHTTRLRVRRDGSILVGSFEAGLRSLAPGAARTSPLAASGPISLLLEGPSGAILLGERERLLVLGPDGSRHSISLDGPPAGLVTAIALEGERVWAGSFDGGLARLDPDGWRGEPLRDPRVTALALDPDRRLLIGTASGLLLRSPGRPPLRVRDPRGWLGRHIAALRPAPEGSVVWVAAHPGLVALETARERPGLDARYFGATGKEADAGLASPTVYGLAVARDGIWVATDEGLSRMRLGSTRSLTDLGGELPDNWLNDVRLAEDGTLHVLTLRSGLLRIGAGGTQVLHGRFMTGPGVLLPIATPAGRAVLLGSNADGLIVLDEPEGSRGTARARTYSLAQGLPARTVASLAYDARNDRLWVGGDAGITRIDGAARQLGIGAAFQEPMKERE